MIDPALPPSLVAEFDELKRRLTNLERSSSLDSASIRDGRLRILDEGGSEVGRLGKLADGSYGLAFFDDAGVERVRFGELVGGGYGTKLNLGIAAVNSTSSRNSVTFGDPTSGVAGPEVTITTGARALVVACAQISTLSGGDSGVLSYAISGATTSAANATDSRYARLVSTAGGAAASVARVCLEESLTPGSNTFSMKFSTTALVEFTYRSLWVIPL